MCEQNCFVFGNSAICKLHSKRVKMDKRKTPLNSGYGTSHRNQLGKKKSFQCRQDLKVQIFPKCFKTMITISKHFNQKMQSNSLLLSTRRTGGNSTSKRISLMTLNCTTNASHLHYLEHTAAITQTSTLNSSLNHTRDLPASSLVCSVSKLHMTYDLIEEI